MNMSHSWVICFGYPPRKVKRISSLTQNTLQSPKTSVEPTRTLSRNFKASAAKRIWSYLTSQEAERYQGVTSCDLLLVKKKYWNRNRHIERDVVTSPKAGVLGQQMQLGQFSFKFCSKDVAIVASTMHNLGNNATMQGAPTSTKLFGKLLNKPS